MKKTFKIPGLFHDIIVKNVATKSLDRSEGDEVTMGTYSHFDCTIKLSKDLTTEVKRHTLYHEIAHHILDTLEEMKDEEDKCNLLASYLMKLNDEREKIDKVLK